MRTLQVLVRLFIVIALLSCSPNSFPPWIFQRDSEQVRAKRRSLESSERVCIRRSVLIDLSSMCSVAQSVRPPRQSRSNVFAAALLNITQTGTCPTSCGMI